MRTVAAGLRRGRWSCQPVARANSPSFHSFRSGSGRAQPAAGTAAGFRRRDSPQSMTATREFNPARLALARRRRGLTKVKLAELIKVEARSITGFEGGEYCPDDETMRRLTAVLRFPVAFFFGDDLE